MRGVHLVPSERTIIDDATDPNTTAGLPQPYLRRAVVGQFEQFVKLNKKIPTEILASVSSIEDAGRLADTLAAHAPIKLENKQAVLALFSVEKRLEFVLEQLQHRYQGD